MKRFLLKVSLFLIPILVVSVAVDYWISNKLKKTHLYQGELEVWQDIYTGQAQCNLAIYGSSRAWVHINPKTLENKLNLSSYNFGIDGHNFWLQYLRHIEFVENNPTPKYIVMTVDVFSLAKRKDLFLYPQFIPYMFWNYNIYEYTKSYDGFNLFDYYLPLIRYFGRKKVLINCFKNTSKISFRNKGFKGINKTWNEDYAIAQSNHPNFVIKNNPESVLLFKRFLEECKEDGIKVIFVYTPEHVLGQKFVKNRDELVSTLYSISMEYNIPFLDYSNDSICKNERYFYNASHLNKEGANLFSQKLANDLMALIN